MHSIFYMLSSFEYFEKVSLKDILTLFSYSDTIALGDLNMEQKIKRSKNLYIIEAALEYFIYLLSTGTFLATITTKLGFSDAQTGILSSIISLGHIFQLISLFIRPKRNKTIVIILSIANQLLFTLLYVIPLQNESNSLSRMAFVIVILTAYLLYYIANPKKINWFMSLIDDKERGRFTANKEIISLVSGMAITFGMGALVDYFEAKNDIKTALIICGITLFVLTILHSLTMIFSVEKESVQPENRNVFKNLGSLCKEKNIRHISILFIIWFVSQSVTTPFLATYYLSDLGIGLSVTALIAIMGSVARIFISRFWGTYADKNSFAKMVTICFSIVALAFVAIFISGPEWNIFTPMVNSVCKLLSIENFNGAYISGIILITIYTVLHAMAMGGINSSITNLVFDYVPEEKRTDSLAITQTIGGVSGFLATLAISPLVDFVQKNGNSIFGIQIHAQQLTAIISVILTITAAVYTKKVLIGKK